MEWFSNRLDTPTRSPPLAPPPEKTPRNALPQTPYTHLLGRLRTNLKKAETRWFNIAHINANNPTFRGDASSENVIPRSHRHHIERTHKIKISLRKNNKTTLLLYDFQASRSKNLGGISLETFVHFVHFEKSRWRLSSRWRKGQRIFSLYIFNVHIIF